MNIEIEAKMPLRDPAALERRLVALRAVRALKLLEINTFFDTPQATLKAADQGLRLRMEREPDGPHAKVTLTHKGPRAHGRLKSRAETEVEVADARAAAELLSALGFAPVFAFEKRRELWELDHCQVAVDELPLLGRFVEIEGPTDAAVLGLREKLGLADVPLIHANYIAMLRTYLTEHGIEATHVRFDSEQAPADAG